MKLIDITLKDLLRAFRSLFLVGMTVAAPLVIVVLMSLAFGGFKGGKADLPAMSVGVLNLDQPAAGSPALGELLEGIFFDESVAGWLTASRFTDEEAGRAAVNRQEIGVAVIIPADFSDALLNGKPGAPVQMIHDPTLTIAPLVVRNMIESYVSGVEGAQVAIQVISERRAVLGTPLQAEDFARVAGEFQTWYIDFQRALFHSSAGAISVRAPGGGSDATGEGQNFFALATIGQVIFFGFYTGAYAMMSILRESEEGTLARIFTTPTSRTVVLAGKLLAVLLTVLIQAITMMVAAGLIFKIRWGQPGSVALATAAHVIAASGLGVLLISFVKTIRQAGPVLGAGLTVLGMVGGLFTVAIKMPAGFEKLGLFTPQGWVLRGWKLAVAGAAPSELIMPALVTLAMGCVMFAAGAWMFRRRFA